MNKFVFRPVGQGLFYTGSLLNGCYNFVYDCGNDNQSILNKEIQLYQDEADNNCKNKPQIDFVVISHLHKDHCIGLYKLVQNFRVGKIYLPYLSCSNDVLRLYLYYDLFIDTHHSENLQENLILYRLIASLYGLDDSNFYREYIEERDLIRESKTAEYYDDNNKVYWQFKFIYNKFDSNKVDLVNEKCRVILKNAHCDSMEKFIALNKGNLELIAQAYKEIFGDGNALNNTSIVLLHYPSEGRNYLSYCNFNNFMHRRILCYRYRICHRCMQERTSGAITLLTGDIKFNNTIANELKTYIQNRKLSVLQIPHHGSKENWKSFYRHKINSQLYVIPFGYGNKHKHPNIEVINDLMGNNEEFYCVTQTQGFVYYID